MCGVGAVDGPGAGAGVNERRRAVPADQFIRLDLDRGGSLPETCPRPASSPYSLEMGGKANYSGVRTMRISTSR